MALSEMAKRVLKSNCFQDAHANYSTYQERQNEKICSQLF